MERTRERPRRKKRGRSTSKTIIDERDGKRGEEKRREENKSRGETRRAREEKKIV